MGAPILIYALSKIYELLFMIMIIDVF